MDDCRNPINNAPEEFLKEEIVWVKSYEEFDEYMKNNPMPTMISFDYVLGQVPNKFNDGFACAKSVLRKCCDENVPWPRYRIHSTYEEVHVLRDYITHNLRMQELGDAVEEDYVKSKVPETGSTTIPAKKQQSRNDKCACGSSKKFKHCCGK